MHATDLLAKACPEEWKEPLPQEPVDGICCLTGRQCLTIKRNKIFGSSFTESQLFKAPSSDRVGVNVWHAFKAGYFAAEGKKRKKKPEAMSCWWANAEEWIELDKAIIRDIVFNGRGDLPWAGWITTSYKKHGATRAKVNRHKFGVWAFDEMLVDCSNLETVKTWWKVMRKAQDGGITRSTMETLEIPVFALKKIDLALWIEFKNWATDKRQTALYSFLCYLLPSQTELKEINNDKELVKDENCKSPVQLGLFT